jgi:hypothetical protein
MLQNVTHGIRQTKFGLSLQGKNTDLRFDNRVLRRIFGPKMDEVTEGWKKFHNEGH